MPSTLNALVHALAYYFQIKARRADLDTLWECMEREEEFQQRLVDGASADIDKRVLDIRAAKLRVVARARRSVEKRLERASEGETPDSLG